MRLRDNPPKVLIVDDTPENMEIIGKLLESEGYDLYLADNGRSAIELVSYNSFDLILMDVMMPELDGFETFSEIKRLDEGFDVPLIYLTAKVDIESIVKGFEMGGADYIRKPFNSLELKARVKHQLDLRQMRQKIEDQNQALLEANERLKTASLTDPLTTLFNRREILLRVEHEIARFERNGNIFSILIGDIDDFKRINDEHGHQVGDDVLKQVSKVFLEQIRKQDTVARWGGEEFIFLLPQTDDVGVLVLAEKLRSTVESTQIKTERGVIRITMTFGCCSFQKMERLEAFIDKADQALYTGKKNGKNQVFVWSQACDTHNGDVS